MKRIIIGVIVGTVIYFAYQSAMWMSGIHSGFGKYTPNQTAIMQNLNQNITEDGMYWMPTADPKAPDYEAQEEKMMTENVGKPWAMVFYHKAMPGMTAGYVLMGVFYTVLGCLVACLLIYYGNFASFGTRFLASMALAAFALSQCVLDDMNWMSYPWHFVQPQVIDLILGWGITSVWLAWFVKRVQS